MTIEEVVTLLDECRQNKMFGQVTLHFSEGKCVLVEVKQTFKGRGDSAAVVTRFEIITVRVPQRIQTAVTG